MKPVYILLPLLSLGLIGVFGCGASWGRTAEERAHMYRTITGTEWQMAKDDIDNFLLVDRRSRLTRWH